LASSSAVAMSAEQTSCQIAHRSESCDGGEHADAKFVSYANLTPWVTQLFFLHTYYAYISVFFMFLLMFYKGYALEYPPLRRVEEMVLIMVIPVLQHIRFYFGFWGCEGGGARELCVFVLFCTTLLWVLMYFLFRQAYILPLDAMITTIAVAFVLIEGFCGIINLLQSVKLHTLHKVEVVAAAVNIICFLVTTVMFVMCELSPSAALEEMIKPGPTALLTTAATAHGGGSSGRLLGGQR